MDTVEVLVFELLGSWWLLPAIALLSAADGFTIILPSETVLAAVAGVASGLGTPNLWLLWAAATAGAHLGDVGVFALGRLLARARWFQAGRRFSAAIDWTTALMDRRGPLVIMAGRYIPYGRLAVSGTAGWSGYPTVRFVALSAVGCSIWAAAYVGIGAGAASWFGNQWWLAIAVAIAIAVATGVLLDRIIRRRLLAQR